MASLSSREARYKHDIMPEDLLFDARPDDLIILVMGPTAAGKSTFINTFYREEIMRVVHGLKQGTQQVNTATTLLPEDHPVWPNRRLVLVDTPGFDDYYQGVLEKLRKISTWLAHSYDIGAKVTGLVWVHSIGMNRLDSLSYDLFRSMCGPNAFSRVVMVTSQWDTISRQVGEYRENELRTMFWKEILTQGAHYRRIEEPSRDIVGIIEHLLEQEAVTIRIQEELVDLDQRVAETEAGKLYISTLEKWLGPGSPETEDLSQEREEESKGPGFPVDGLPVLDRIKSLFRRKKGRNSPRHGITYRLDITPEDRLFTDARPDDLIIVVIGLTGAGKSSFINRFCGEERMKVNHGLRSCTEQIGVALHTFPSTHQVWPGRRLVLVDTPGFDDSNMQGDLETLRRISVWLADVYESKNMQVKVAGLVYLQNIGRNRMEGSSRLSYEAFRSICGPIALGRVVMASTQWDTVLYDPSAGPIREGDLKEFWKTTLAQGAVYRRVDAMDPKRDTEDIINYILRKHAVATQIQKELVELGKRVAETEAAQKLREKLEKWLGDPQMESLSEENEEQLKEFPIDAGFVDWVKGLFRLKNEPEGGSPYDRVSKAHD